MLKAWLKRVLASGGGSSSATPGGFEALEGRTLMSVDLAISVGKLVNGFDSSNNPTVSLPITVQNVGGSPVTGSGKIELYLSADRTFDANDFLFKTVDQPRVRGINGSAKITVNTKQPQALTPGVGRAIPAGDYYIIARLAPAASAHEIGGDNNIAVTTKKTSITYTFGLVGDKAHVPLVLTLADGDVVTLNLDKGPGTGRAIAVDNRVSIIIDGSSTQTTLRMIPGSKSQTPTLAGLTINGNIKNITAAGVNINGNVTITGRLGSVIMGDLSNSTFTMNGFAPSWNASFGKVKDSSLRSPFTPMSSLDVEKWTDTDSVRDTVSVPFMKSLGSAGTFAAGLTLTGQHTGYSIETVKIGKDLSRGTWNLSFPVAYMKVGSINSDWSANIPGTIEALTINGNAGGSLGVGNIRRLIVKGDVRDARYLIGANLGADGQLQGTSGGDSFASGRIGVLEIRGRMIRSVIGTGVGTQNAVLGDADDRLTDGSIDDIEVRRGFDATSFIITKTPPTSIKVNFVAKRSADEPHILTALPPT